jgi:CheY-like chemotaxis protein
MTTVLLVEDHPSPSYLFTQVFGAGAVTWIKSARDAVDLIEQGYRPDVAFIDFELGLQADDGTGLAVWLAFRTHSPETRGIAYTTLSENGRTLYAVAARHWLGAAAVVDKSADGQMILALARGANAMHPGWQEKLRHASLIDGIFAKPLWLEIWRVWGKAHGSVSAVITLAGAQLTPTGVRKFQDDAVSHVLALRTTVLGEEIVEDPNRGNNARQAPLTAFAHAHSMFFAAPELRTVLDIAKPWERFEPAPAPRARGTRRLRRGRNGERG